MNPEPFSFLSSLVGGRTRPRRPFTDPFSSPVPSWGNVPEADSEAGDLDNIRRKYLIHPSVGMRSPTEFERAPDGGAGEVTVYEAYLEVGFRGVIPSLIEEVSSFFGFSPSQLTPWRTLMSIQVHGELHGFSIKPVCVREDSGASGLPYVLAHCGCVSPGFLCWRSSGETYNGNSPAIPLGDFSGNVARSPVSVIYDEYQKVKAQKRRLSYTPQPRLVRAALSVGGLSSILSTSTEIMPNRDLLADAHQRLTSEVFLLRGQVRDMMACRDLLIQQVRASARWELMKEWLEKRDLVIRRLHGDPGIIGDEGSEALLGSLDRVWDPEVPIRPHGIRRFTSRIRRSWLEPGGLCGCDWTLRSHKSAGLFLRSGERIGTLNRIGPLRPCWNPEVWIRRSLFGTRRFFEVVMTPMRPRPPRGPEIVWGTLGFLFRSGARIRTRSSLGTRKVLIFAGTVLRLPRKDYYRYLFGFRILPLGSWPLSSSYAVFYFCRKSLTGLEGAGVGVLTQVPGLLCFPRLEKQDLDCSLYFTVLLQ
ncbi:hypothetical protein F2Q70_00003732 [Brassica cretica]|uniref:Uncharacterized protein n=1 Tax=Brassica cretica TaxID=69181 RepID=A0A8S9IMB2_BRACR|nr:hypothetical protein F2Q70_00003732 [Brassica cretica]